MRVTSALVHHISQYYPYKEYCEQHHKDIDPTSCAIAYTWYKPNDRFKLIGKQNLDLGNTLFIQRQYILFDYLDPELDQKIVSFLTDFSRYIMHLGLFFYMLGIKFNKRRL